MIYDAVKLMIENEEWIITGLYDNHFTFDMLEQNINNYIRTILQPLNLNAEEMLLLRESPEYKMFYENLLTTLQGEARGPKNSLH